MILGQTPRQKKKKAENTADQAYNGMFCPCREQALIEKALGCCHFICSRFPG